MLRLKPVNEKDKSFLWEMLKERPKEANISHVKMPRMSSHEQFVKHWDVFYIDWNIIMDDQEKLGQVYITARNEIGVQIKPERQSKGYAKWAIREVMRRHMTDATEFYANVAPLNFKSQRLFTSMGFKHIQNTYKLGVL